MKRADITKGVDIRCRAISVLLGVNGKNQRKRRVRKMQIVIEIDEGVYKDWKWAGKYASLSYAQRIILDGKPLPKGHGRLKDVDAFISKVKADRKHSAYSRSWTADDVLIALDNSYAPTIIEADGGEKNGHSN